MTKPIFFTKVLTPLNYYGRMALTNYIFQSVFFYLYKLWIWNGSFRHNEYDTTHNYRIINSDYSDGIQLLLA